MMLRKLSYWGCVLLWTVGWGATAAAQTSLTESDTQQAARQRIETALEKKASLMAVDETLKDVIKQLEHQYAIPMKIDEASLAESAVGASDVPITRSIAGVSLRALLELILHPLELTWIIDKEYLLVTTKDRAESMYIIKAYPVGDLARDLTPKENDVAFTSQTPYWFLVDLMGMLSEDSAWCTDGGGSDRQIEIVETLGILVVRETGKVHRKIELFLKNSWRGDLLTTGRPKT